MDKADNCSSGEYSDDTQLEQSKLAKNDTFATHVAIMQLGLLGVMMTTVTAMYLITRSERNPAVFPLDKREDNSELKMIEFKSSNILDSKIVIGETKHVDPKYGLYFWLTLFIHRALALFCLNSRCFFPVFVMQLDNADFYWGIIC